MKKFGSIVFWAILSAAFVGPGTVTTTSKAGAVFGCTLLWTLTFATLVTIILQEGSARLTILTRRDLGQFIPHMFPGKWGVWAKVFAFSAILIGGMAYEAGNILGALAGLRLLYPVSLTYSSFLLGLLIGFILWTGTIKTIPKLMGALVGVMGLAFCTSAFFILIQESRCLIFLIKPSFPSQSGTLVLGLIGTTIVPYNLFMGSALAHTQDLKLMRWGLIPAILGGGIVSMSILVVGTTITTSYSFEALSRALALNLGEWSRILFAVGLFSAGFTSALTAPFATALTARSLFSGEELWHERHRVFRVTWVSVLGTGVLFGVLGVKPIPVIILAQALNGLLLPAVALFLFFALNYPGLRGEFRTNTLVQNILLFGSLAVCSFLGIRKVLVLFSSKLSLFSGITDYEIHMSALFLTAGFGTAILVLFFQWRRSFLSKLGEEMGKDPGQ